MVQNYLRVIGVALAALFLILMWRLSRAIEEGYPLITIMTFAPMVGAVLLSGMANMHKEFARKLAAGFQPRLPGCGGAVVVAI